MKISILNILGPDVNFAFGEYTYSGGSRFNPLYGPQLEVFFMRSGRVSIICDTEILEVSGPCFAVIASREKLEYRYEPQEVCHVAWCQCIGPGLTPETVKLIKPLTGVLPPSDNAVSLMKMGTELPLQSDEDTPTFSNALAIALFEEFFNRKRLDSPSRKISHQVMEVRQYIEKNIDKPISMSLLGQISNLSPQHLNRLFDAAYGENPLDYLWRLRTRHGAFLLQRTGLRVSQIAYKTGFKTPNHFSRLIKNRFGLSPRELRARRGGDIEGIVEVSGEP